MIKSSQRGFTLIELVVVIVILGILAAFAVPKFMGLETEARVSAVRNLAGTLSSAGAMAHGVCMAQNCPGGTVNNISVNGTNRQFVNQYPSNTNIRFFIEDSNGFTRVNNNQFRKDGAKVPANCWVQYNQAASVNAPPTITFPNGMTLGVTLDATINSYLRANC